MMIMMVPRVWRGRCCWNGFDDGDDDYDDNDDDNDSDDDDAGNDNNE